MRRLMLPAYLCGGVVWTAAAVLNPFSPAIALDTFGLSYLGLIGLIYVRRVMGQGKDGTGAGNHLLPFSWAWTISSAVVGLAFVAVLGRGVRLRF